MRQGKTQRRLKKELGLLDVCAIATGTTLSAGFFLLPGIGAAQAGPAMIIACLIALRVRQRDSTLVMIGKSLRGQFLPEPGSKSRRLRT